MLKSDGEEHAWYVSIARVVFEQKGAASPSATTLAINACGAHTTVQTAPAYGGGRTRDVALAISTYLLGASMREAISCPCV
jgi:hypothetical protein